MVPSAWASPHQVIRLAPCKLTIVPVSCKYNVKKLARTPIFQKPNHWKWPSRSACAIRQFCAGRRMFGLMLHCGMHLARPNVHLIAWDLFTVQHQFCLQACCTSHFVAPGCITWLPIHLEAPSCSSAPPNAAPFAMPMRHVQCAMCTASLFMNIHELQRYDRSIPTNAMSACAASCIGCWAISCHPDDVLRGSVS